MIYIYTIHPIYIIESSTPRSSNFMDTKLQRYFFKFKYVVE